MATNRNQLVDETTLSFESHTERQKIAWEGAITMHPPLATGIFCRQAPHPTGRMARSRRLAYRGATIKVLLALAACGMLENSIAQESIEEVVVTAPKRERRALHPAVEIDRARIAERAPAALTDILKSLPSVGIRTNSRGETVLRLRGSEERQTGIFLDGAPLGVPWDGRVDLSALPAGIVDGVRVTPSAAPIEYGPNSVLGAVDIQTPISIVPGLRSLQGELATEHGGSLSAVGGASTGAVDWLFGGGYRRLGGEAVSSRGVIPYGPVKDGARANTDLESTSLFVAASRRFDQAAARVSLLSVAAERGIANAGHIDPAVGLPRYWRYPHWRFDQLTLNVGSDIGASASLRSVLWFQHFEQTIDQYVDDSYSVVENSEDAEDNTLGGRMVLERPFDAFDLRLVGNAQVTIHEQLNTDHVNGIRVPLTSYQQNVFSLGAELDREAGETVDVSASLSYDLATTPRTGGHNAYDELSDWAASIAMRWYPSDTWQVAGTLGQRTRFPTLRELYGEALGQFLLNPGLRPETTLMGDVTFEGMLRNGQLRLRLTPWMLRVDDTLSRRSLVVDGVRLRQRYNLEGSTGHGIEAGLDWNVHDLLELRLNASWQDLKARPEDDDARPGLYQRPDVQAALALDWVFAPAWDLFLEVRYMGEALDEDEYGMVVTLPSSTSVDFRLFRTVQRDDSGQWRVYFGVDNLANDVVLPQLGLPRPGRTASLGLTFERL